MDEDKAKDTEAERDDVLPEGRRRNRAPTIDLKASRLSDDPSPQTAEPEAADSDISDQSPGVDDGDIKPRGKSASLLWPAFAGALAGAVVLVIGMVAGWLWAAQEHPASSAAALQALGDRVTRVEQQASAPPVADSAVAGRLAAMEKAVTTLRDDIANLRGAHEKTAATLNEMAATSRNAAAPAQDLTEFEQRLAKIEQSMTTLKSEAASPPADDVRLRRVAAASLLDMAVRQGQPYGDALTVAKAVAERPDALQPLQSFAASGIPGNEALARELLALRPQWTPQPQASPSKSTGMLDRLQQSASRLVHIQRVDGKADDNGAVAARVTAAAERNDIVAARRELNALPVDQRAQVQSWIDRVDARDAALAASRAFVSNAMAALAQPGR